MSREQWVDKLPENAVKIPGTLNWVCPNGDFYGVDTRLYKNRWQTEKKPGKNYGKYFKYTLSPNKKNGYIYIGLKFETAKDKYETKSVRAHVIVAKIFIDNPNNYPVVGHRNNIKSDNRVENLYWTTIQENTQKAFDDGLAKNASGYEDSQSNPVIMFETCTNKELGKFGSAREAERKTGVGINTILRQCRYKKPVRKPYYFRFQNDPSINPPPVIIQYDYKTDKEIARFYNTGDASRKTGIIEKVISQQCANGFKPKTKTKSGTYFLRQIINA